MTSIRIFTFSPFRVCLEKEVAGEQACQTFEGDPHFASSVPICININARVVTRFRPAHFAARRTKFCAANRHDV